MTNNPKKQKQIEVTPENLEAVLAEHGCHGPDWGLLPHRADYRDSQSTSEDANDTPVQQELTRLIDGEKQSEVASEDQTSIDRAALLSVLMEWIGECKASDARAVNYIGKRAIAALWVLNPERFGNLAAHKVAKSFGLSPCKFKWITAEFSRRFKVQNQFQAHDWQN